MAEHRLRYGIIWGLLLAFVFVAAALITSASPGRRWLGLAMLLAPLLAFGLVQVAFYLKSRAQAMRASVGRADDADAKQ